MDQLVTGGQSASSTFLSIEQQTIFSIEQQTIFVFADKPAFVIFNHVCPKIKHASWLAHWFIYSKFSTNGTGVRFQTIDAMTKLELFLTCP